MDIGLHNLRVWMVISGIMYAFAGLAFLFFQNKVISQINWVSEKFFKDKFLSLPLSVEKFWLVLTTSMMLMLVICSIFIASDPADYREMTVIVLFSKICSTALYTFFFSREKYFAYLVGALTDGPLFLITLIFYLWAL